MIQIYSKEQCQSCDSARALLKEKGVPFSEKKLNKDFTREWLLETFPNAKTFPVIVVDGFHIGGYTQLTEMINKISSEKIFLTE